MQKLIDDIKDIDTRIITEEARQTPIPITKQAQMVCRHLRRAREALSDARMALRLAIVEATRSSTGT